MLLVVLNILPFHNKDKTEKEATNLGIDKLIRVQVHWRRENKNKNNVRAKGTLDLCLMNNYESCLKVW